MPKYIRAGGIVDIRLSPPLDFIEAQQGAFRMRLRDFTGLWERFSRTMTKIELDGFATEGHGEWPPLAESTLLDKERHGFPPFPLIRTGELYQSLTEPQRAASIAPWSMTWGSDVDYAVYHQGFRPDGTPTDPGRPPVRKPLDLSVEDRRMLETDMVAWLNEVAAETFGRS